PMLPASNSLTFSLEKTLYFLFLLWCYFVVYLGLGRLLVALVRQYTFVSLTAGFLIHMIILLAACGVPQVIAYISPRYRFGDEYSLLHITNPFWTLKELLDQ